MYVFNGPFSVSFFFIFVSPIYRLNTVESKIKFDTEHIPTADFWNRKQPLYQLSHNHSPKNVPMFDYSLKISNTLSRNEGSVVPGGDILTSPPLSRFNCKEKAKLFWQMSTTFCWTPILLSYERATRSVTRFAKISLLWQNFISLWQFLDGIRVFGKMVVLWQIVNAIGQILIDVKSAKF